MTRRIAYCVLWGLLLVLAVRLTMTEQARQTLAQMTAQHMAAAETKGTGGGAMPVVGPGVTTGLAAITFLLAGIAAWCAGISGALTLRRLGRFALIVAVLALGTVSALGAADRFVAVVGLSDLAMALLAGWAVGLLCQQTLLGDKGRRMVVMAIVALAAAWAAKGIYQRTIDIPETIAYFNAHKEEALDQALGPSQNRSPEDSEVKLFESRMNSKEVTGFVTLSNVMGTGMVGLLAVLAGLIGLAAKGLRGAPMEEPPRGGGGAGGGEEIPLPVLLLCMAVLVELAGMATLFLSASRGASVIGVAVIAAVFAGAFTGPWVVKRRRKILAGAAIAIILGAAAGISYGLARDRLPGKSLMFRWHYWTASAKLIERSPWEGVGLNNFGDYYTSVKRSSSPEDVKDPHSFFVRIAAEMGVPAAGVVGLLILWMILGATRITKEKEATDGGGGIGWAIAGGVIFCAAWWAIHQLLAEAPDLYSVELSVLYAVLTAAAWALAAGMLGLEKGRGMRFLALAALGGAAGMLLYDQINMALVTGPVAMLFWVLLGMSDSYAPPPIAPPTALPTPAGAIRVIGAMAGAVACVGAGVVLAAGFWWPTVEGRMAWDASPYVQRYLEVMQRAANGGTPDFAAAQAALEQAIARSPRVVDLRRQLMLVKAQLHEPVAGDIRAMLTLDRANARIRMDLAMPESDLPAAERIAILEQALRFDDTLPADEVMRLGAANRAAIQAKIGELQGRGHG